MTRFRRFGYALCAGSILAAVLVVAPPQEVQAIGGSLTVVTLGRDGRPVTASLEAVNATSNVTSYLRSGRAKALPAGTYLVIVDIYNLRDGTDTLGAKRVTVSGDTR